MPLLAAARAKNDMTHAATYRRVGHRLSGVRIPVCNPLVCAMALVSVFGFRCVRVACHAYPLSKVSVNLVRKKLFLGDCNVTEDIKRHIALLSAVVVPNRMSADALVVYDVANPGSRSRWAAVMLGLPLVGLRCLSGASGPAIEYPAAIARKFTVCMTPEFQRVYPLLSNIITLSSAKPASRWRLVSDVPARAGATWLVFATPVEASTKGIPQACTPAAFMRRFVKPTGMAMGVCGL